MMATEKNETKSYVFYGFLSICSVDRHENFVEVSSSIVSEVIRTIFFFFLRENFMSTKSTKRHI